MYTIKAQSGSNIETNNDLMYIPSSIKFTVKLFQFYRSNYCVHLIRTINDIKGFISLSLLFINL